MVDAKVREWIPCNLCGCETPSLIFGKKGYDIVQCPKCALIYVGNQPTPEELSRLYSFESGYHRALEDDTSALCRGHLRDSARYLSCVMKHRRSGRILDVGCSTGFFLDAARSQGWSTYGVELSEDTARIAREKHGLDVKTGVLTEGAYPASSFDVVTLWDVIEHVCDPKQLLATVSKMLAPNGLVALSTPCADGLFPLLSYQASRLTGLWPHVEPPYHLFQFSRKTITEMLSSAGLEVVEFIHQRTNVSYTLGPFWKHWRFPKMMLYVAVLAPTILVGPLLHMGDSATVIAVKKGT